MSFPKYPEYKESGVEWLGDVPSHWQVNRLKWSIRSCINGVWGKDSAEDENDIICVRVADFDRERHRISLNSPTVRNVTSSERAGRVLRPGNLVLEKSGGGEKRPVGFVVLYEYIEPAVCSNFTARIDLAEGMDPVFWCLMHSALYSVRLNVPSIRQTSGIQNLNQSSYFDELVPYPTIDEQRAIANFLQNETAKIDALIAEQKRLIELLKEKRQAVITRAVTRGLDSDVAMKDSGVEWLGEVPEHWVVVQLRYKAKLESGHTPSRSKPEYWVNCTIPWFTLSDVWQIRKEGRRFITDTKEKVSELGLRNSSARLLPAGSVILSRTASVGFPAILGTDMAVSQDFAVWVCDGEVLANEFLWYVLLGMRPEFDRLMMGSTHQTIYMPDLKVLKLAIPSTPEQQQIARQLDVWTNKFDSLVEEAQVTIRLLIERRSALISAAVNGKIDVRGWDSEQSGEEIDLPMAAEERGEYA